MIEPGSAAPDFTLENQDGESVSVVVDFYPKAHTPGCA